MSSQTRFTGLGNDHALVVSAQREVALLDVPEFALEEDFELPQKEEAMRGYEDLDACFADAKDRLRDLPDQPRIEVGLGLVPEQAVLREAGLQVTDGGSGANGFRAADLVASGRAVDETATGLLSRHAVLLAR